MNYETVGDSRFSDFQFSLTQQTSRSMNSIEQATKTTTWGRKLNLPLGNSYGANKTELYAKIVKVIKTDYFQNGLDRQHIS